MMLQDRHGWEWFADPEAGAWIKRLWCLGQKFTAEQLLLKNEGGILGTDQIRHHIERVLGRLRRRRRRLQRGGGRGQAAPAGRATTWTCLRRGPSNSAK